MKNKIYYSPKVTVILPVIDEKISLIKTIKIILKNNKKDIEKIFLILDKKKNKNRLY